MLFAPVTPVADLQNAKTKDKPNYLATTGTTGKKLTQGACQNEATLSRFDSDHTLEFLWFKAFGSSVPFKYVHYCGLNIRGRNL